MWEILAKLSQPVFLLKTGQGDHAWPWGAGRRWWRMRNVMGHGGWGGGVLVKPREQGSGQNRLLQGCAHIGLEEDFGA